MYYYNYHNLIVIHILPPESEGTVHTFATENLLIPDKTFTTARNEYVGVNFLEYL